MKKIEFEEIEDYTKLIDLSQISLDIDLLDFQSEFEEYSKYIKECANQLQDQFVSHTHLLVDVRNNNIVSYITLITDSVILSQDEKNLDAIANIPFSTLPALKIGKLAVNKKYNETYHGIGSVMIKIATGFAFDINQSGVGCRYLTADADIENNPTVDIFYRKCGFKPNEKINKKTRRTLSMRKDIFYEE